MLESTLSRVAAAATLVAGMAMSGGAQAGHHTPDFFVNGVATGTMKGTVRVAGCGRTRPDIPLKMNLRRNKSWTLRVGGVNLRGQKYKATNSGSRVTFTLPRMSRVRFTRRLMEKWARKACGKRVRLEVPKTITVKVKLNPSGTRLTGTFTARAKKKKGTGQVRYKGKIRSDFKPR